MEQDLAQRLRTALPGVRCWIEDLCVQHRPEGAAVSSLGFERLGRCFDAELLERVRVVTVAKVPYPPVERLGLPELAPAVGTEISGITFQETVFVRRGQASESLLFHELVHVLQWDQLGADGFLLAYGLGLALYGYEDSPLERMAYSLQRRFDQDRLPPDWSTLVRESTDAIRAELERRGRSRG